MSTTQKDITIFESTSSTAPLILLKFCRISLRRFLQSQNMWRWRDILWEAFLLFTLCTGRICLIVQ